MDRERTFQVELTVLVAEVTGLGRDKIRLRDRLVEDLGLDSFAATELLVLIEQKYKIKISESDLIKNKTLGEWARLIAERCQRNEEANMPSK